MIPETTWRARAPRSVSPSFTDSAACFALARRSRHAAWLAFFFHAVFLGGGYFYSSRSGAFCRACVNRNLYRRFFSSPSALRAFAAERFGA